MTRHTSGQGKGPGLGPQRAGQLYLAVVPIAGLAVLALALADLTIHPPKPAWLALATLTILTGSFTVKIPGLIARLSVSEPFVFAATLWFGPSVGAVTAALDALVMSLWLMPGLKTAHRVLFNLSVLVISIWVSSHAFFALSGIDPHAPRYDSLSDFIGPLFVFTLCCFTLNSGLVALALSFERNESAFHIWRHQFLWLSVNFFGGGSVAALLVVYVNTIDLAVVAIIVPLLIVSYLTFRTTLGRLADATEHLDHLNRLYLSTVETLAMAIDAKDQVTHGHLRRVQKHAVSLATALGVTEATQLKAIEAAALLHDMGKLAIPEHILNKPGRLSPSELEIMKQHARIGADLLSAIDFPYPVVPIVRHHHEHWDGTGYPDGLRGTAIPIGARILAVVDCYDALTSDRPYRPRLSHSDAVAIVIERRGTVYDPLVVDTFLVTYDQVEHHDDDTATRVLLNTFNTYPTLSESHDSSTSIHVLTSINPSLKLLHSLSPTGSAGGLAIDDLGALLDFRLAHVLPYSGLAIFGLDPSHSALLCRFANAAARPFIEHSRLTLGHGVTGWVAANEIAIWNSDAALDLSRDGAAHANFTLCSSLPLLTERGELIGVLTLYGTARQELSLANRYTLESLAPVVSVAVDAAFRRSDSSCIDATTPAARAAVLAIVDSLLSGHQVHPGKRQVKYVYLRRAHGEVRHSDMTSAAARLQTALVAKAAHSTQILRTTESSFLVIQDPADSLRWDAGSIAESLAPAFQEQDETALQVHELVITSPMELREALRAPDISAHVDDFELEETVGPAIQDPLATWRYPNDATKPSSRKTRPAQG